MESLFTLLIFLISITVILLIYVALSISRKPTTPNSAKIWRIGIFVIFLINLFGSIPLIHKGVQFPIDPKNAAVYSDLESVEKNKIPVKHLSQNTIGESGEDQYVHVFLRHSYCDRLLQFYPRLSLIIFAVTSLISWLVSRKYDSKSETA